MKKSLLLACGALAIASAATAQDSTNAPFFPPFGYDLTAFDKSVKPEQSKPYGEFPPAAYG